MNGRTRSVVGQTAKMTEMFRVIIQRGQKTEKWLGRKEGGWGFEAITREALSLATLSLTFRGQFRAERASECHV